MSNHWVYWLAAFMIVLTILTIACALQEYLEWRKLKQSPEPPDRR